MSGCLSGSDAVKNGGRGTEIEPIEIGRVSSGLIVKGREAVAVHEIAGVERISEGTRRRRLAAQKRAIASMTAACGVGVLSGRLSGSGAVVEVDGGRVIESIEIGRVS